jgi:hypothetical protein
MKIFGCSRHAITTAHRMRDDVQYMLNRNKEPSIRQRADPEKVKHFVSWLVESNTLVSGRVIEKYFFRSFLLSNLSIYLSIYLFIYYSLTIGTYGLTTLHMDNGVKYDVPKQIIQSQRNHILVDYMKYCDETGFESLGKTKLYDIINSIKPAQQRAAAGLHQFVVEGIEAWRSLSSIKQKLLV